MALRESQIINALIEAGNLGPSRLWRNNIGVATYRQVRTNRIQKVAYGVGGRGGADLIGFRRGQFVAIEVKSSKSIPLKPHQLQFLKVVKECGGYAAVCYPENLQTILEDLITRDNRGMI